MSIACCSSRKSKRELFWAPDPVVGGRFLMPSGEPFQPSPNAILVLTLRMGFGHLRIAHAMSSWLDEQEAYTYDLLQSQTPETDRLRRIEWFYSKASRIRRTGVQKTGNVKNVLANTAIVATEPSTGEVLRRLSVTVSAAQLPKK